MLIEDKRGLCGCIRLLSCAQVTCCPASSPPPSLAKPPRGNDVWELTHLAIDADRAPRLENGISELTCVIFREVLAFARGRGILAGGRVSLPVERIFRSPRPAHQMGLGHRIIGGSQGRARVGIRFPPGMSVWHAVLPAGPLPAAGEMLCSPSSEQKIPGPARDSRRRYGPFHPMQNGLDRYLMNLISGLLYHLTGRHCQNGPLLGAVVVPAQSRSWAELLFHKDEG